MRRGLVALVLLAGCGGDPGKGTLPPGASAVVAGEGATRMDTGQPFGLMLDPGVRVTVGHDPGGAGDAKDEFRPVEVTVESGEHRGKSGSVARYRLRPIR